MFDFRSKEKKIKEVVIENNQSDSELIMIFANSRKLNLGTLKAVVNGEKLLIGDIDISEEYVNYKIGSKLIERLEEICKEQGIKDIYGNLANVDLDHKDRLIHFYEKHGYSISYENDNPNYWGTISKTL